MIRKIKETAKSVYAIEDVPESEFEKISKDLESRVAEDISNIAYYAFYITPKSAY